MRPTGFDGSAKAGLGTVVGDILLPGWVPLIVEVMKSSGGPHPTRLDLRGNSGSSVARQPSAKRALGSFVRHSKDMIDRGLNDQIPLANDLQHCIRDWRRALECGVLAIGILLWSVSLRPQDMDASGQSRDNDDQVAVGLCGSRVVLATHDRKKPVPPCPKGWRCRSLVWSSEKPQVVDFDLSKTGTKLAVLFEDQTYTIFDLSVSVNPTSTATHHLPKQTYALFSSKGRICIDDYSHTTPCQLEVPENHQVPSDLQETLNCVCTSARSRWRIYTLEPDAHLYAPVLEFAPGETVFPTKTSIWETLGAARPPELTWQSPSKRARRPNDRKIQQAWLDRYTALSGDEKRKQGAVYYCVQSFPGSWLFEFWTYYPFDVGHVEDHPHDTEHVFVEVDKLGGRVVGVLAAAHSSLTPNNLYSALQPDAEPASLPLAVIVEKGKHALAPDINRDRKFTPGLDVNVLSQTSQVWGVRDAIGQSDAHMLAYEASMTPAREWSDAWAVEGFGRYFDLAPFDGLRPVYDLVPFPGDPVLTNSAGLFSQPYADYLLNAHADFRKATSIYKPDVFPFRMVRVGVGELEGSGRSFLADKDSVYSIEYVNDLAHLPLFGRLTKTPLPGRLAFQFMTATTRAGIPVLTYPSNCSPSPCAPVPSGSGFFQRGRKFYLGGQYENSITNLFGYYVGYLRRWDSLKSVCSSQQFSIGVSSACYDTSGQLIQPGLPAREIIGQLGVYFAIPRVRNLTLQVGAAVAWNYATSAVAPNCCLSPTTGVFTRLSVNIWQWRGRNKFGSPPTR